MTVVTVRGESYHMDDNLFRRWNKIKNGKLAQYDEDRFYITDGTEGVGKSLFTLQQAAFIDETILDDEKGKLMPRICFSAEEFLKAIRNTRSTKEHTKAVVFDEAFRGLSSKGALSKNNKMIVQALMEARQNNLVVFIVSPSFYLIELYAAVLRSQALFHVVKEKKTRLRYVRIFGKKDKAILYQIGVRKGWGYPRKTRYRARFFNKYPGGAEFEKRYRLKKRKSIQETDFVQEKEHKWKEQRNALAFLYKKTGKSLKKMVDELESLGVHLSKAQLGQITSKYDDITEASIEETDENDEE